jgi:hypothetical protein
MTITLSLKWVLVVLALAGFLIPLWAMSWRRYDGWGNFGWLVEMFWMWPVSCVCVIWALVEFFR